MEVDDDASVWIGEGCELGDGVKLLGRVVLGDGCRVGAGAALRDTIVFPGTDVAEDAIMIGAIAGHSGIVESLRPLDALEGVAGA